MKSPAIVIMVLIIAALSVLVWSPDESDRSAHAGSNSTGDANCDGTINSIDAAIILQFNAGLLAVLPCPENADANGDGTINSVDSVLILQHTVGYFHESPEAAIIARFGAGLTYVEDCEEVLTLGLGYFCSSYQSMRGDVYLYFVGVYGTEPGAVFLRHYPLGWVIVSSGCSFAHRDCWKDVR